jgi:Zn-finger nucleic acid-binding protein
MPLIVCPNDSASMQTVQRSGVEFDFCPTCRGVWLDRGELEKLMAASQPDEIQQDPARDRDPRRYEVQRRDRADAYRDDDQDRYRRKKGFNLFDIFD